MTKKVHGGPCFRINCMRNIYNEYMHTYILGRSAVFPCHVGTSLPTPGSSKHDRHWASGHSPTGHGSWSVPECRGHQRTSSQSSGRWSSLAWTGNSSDLPTWPQTEEEHWDGPASAKPGALFDDKLSIRREWTEICIRVYFRNQSQPSLCTLRHTNMYMYILLACKSCYRHTTCYIAGGQVELINIKTNEKYSVVDNETFHSNAAASTN